MSKFNDFYKKAIEDESIRNEAAKILGSDTFENASDEKLQKIGELAKKAGFEFTLDEVKAYFCGGEIGDDDLDAVAGGTAADKNSGPNQGPCPAGIIEEMPCPLGIANQ